MTILLIFTFISGLLTILAPCIWPLLPIILSSSTQEGKKRPLGITLGIAISFAFFTLTISYLVRIFPFDVDNLRLLAVIVIGLMGITFVVPKFTQVLEGFVSKLTGKLNPISNAENTGFKGGFITGLSLGIVWSPCAGPILASIATLAATQAVNLQVVLVTLVYVTGVSIPLFLFATFGQKLFTRTRFFSANLGRIQQIFGVIMLLTALAIYTGYDRILQARLLDFFPSYTQFLNDLEGNDDVLEQLDKLQGDITEDDMLIKKEDMSIVFTDALTNKARLPDYGKAPEVIGIFNWLNSEPQTIESLKGKVVLIDFWTYTCINCIRTFPHVTAWHEMYEDDGLVILGVHTPEFEFEKDTENVAKSLEQYGITYPVAQDNDFKTWRNYKNRYWPAKYLIDRGGNIRYYHFGEGKYEETEDAIRQLLAETVELTDEKTGIEDLTPNTQRTPELYLGLSRMQNLTSDQKAQLDITTFTASKTPPRNSFNLTGTWDIQEEYSESVENATLELNFKGNKVFLVITPMSDTSEIKVYLDGNLITKYAGEDITNGSVNLDKNRLYELVDFGGDKTNGVLKLEFSSGIRIFAFTFG